MDSINVKKVIRRIYSFDLKNCELEDGNEMINTTKGNEFVNTFIKRDLDNGIMVTPSGYSKGLVYNSTNNGEFKNKPEWVPDIVTFTFNLFGLKKGAFYRLTVISRNTHKFNRLSDVTDDRKLEVSNDNQELLINEDLSNVMENKEFTGIFRAITNEANIFFRIGKIYISDIIIDEVELLSDENVIASESEEEASIELNECRKVIAAYGVFNTVPIIDNADVYKGRYIELTKLTGKGINLYYDKVSKEYILERDNSEDTLNEVLTSIKFFITFNFNKAVNKDLFSNYRITEVSSDISPNTLKQGYIKFVFVDKDENVADYYNREGRLAFLVEKLV